MVNRNISPMDGTAYQIDHGNALIDGTKYAIKKGRTLVDGTGYDIILSETAAPVSITVVGGAIETGTQAAAYVLYNGQKYVDTAFEVQPGETVQVYLYSISHSEASSQYVKFGNSISYGSSQTFTYDYTPVKSSTITITMVVQGIGIFRRPVYSTAVITEDT